MKLLIVKQSAKTTQLGEKLTFKVFWPKRVENLIYVDNWTSDHDFRVRKKRAYSFMNDVKHSVRGGLIGG